MRRLLCRECDATRVEKRLVGDFVDRLRFLKKKGMEHLPLSIDNCVV